MIKVYEERTPPPLKRAEILDKILAYLFWMDTQTLANIFTSSRKRQFTCLSF